MYYPKYRASRYKKVANLGNLYYLCPCKGEMQEWLNWPAWKASKPQKGFGGSNPPLSAKPMEQRGVE